MSGLQRFERYVLCFLLMSCLFVSTFPNRSHAYLAIKDARMISDSEEPLDRRIYSYDMGIDSKGDVHLVYSKPLGDRTAQIYYVTRVGGIKNETFLTSNGYRASVSTYLSVRGDDRVYICYIKDEGPSGNLYFTALKNGVVVIDETYVDSGGWHTRMQLDDFGDPVFIRDNITSSEPKTKLALVKMGGDTWEKTYIDLPPVTKFRIADFIYQNGVYHITYGDSTYTRKVLEFHHSSKYIDGIFHNLHYAKSTDGVNWKGLHTLDSSGTLYEKEFWTSLVLDGGNPMAAMYKYNEYGDKYATGTSAILMTYSGGSWQKKTITDTTFPNSREGMGVGLAVNTSGDYFGAWNYSPDYIIPDPELSGLKGNTALVRNGPKNDWTEKGQVDPISLEGRAKLKIHGNSLFFLGLLDFTNVKLYFREYSMPYLNTALKPSGWSPPNPNASKGLPAIYYLLRGQSE